MLVTEQRDGTRPGERGHHCCRTQLPGLGLRPSSALELHGTRGHSQL